MKFVLVFGKTPVLSLAEFLAWAEARQIKIEIIEQGLDWAIVTGPSEQQAQSLMEEAGGLVKLGILDSSLNNNHEQLAADLAEQIHGYVPDSAVTFGLSWYGEKSMIPNDKRQLAIGLATKKVLIDYGHKVRFVSATGNCLTSVQVTKNKLTGLKGVELLMLASGKNVLIARTLAVQPFQDWSERDFGRPGRDPKSGMLPPKLARTMVNLLGLKPHGSLLDPFCGSGTVLTEAAALGWTKLVGADEAERAIKDTEKNIKWFEKKYQLELNHRLHKVAIDHLSSVVATSSVSAVVTEGFLGPALSKPATPREREKHQDALQPIYKELFKQLARVLVPNGRAVIVLPRWVDRDGVSHPLLKVRAVLPPGVRVVKYGVSEDILIYKRAGQFVEREIVVLERKPKTEHPTTDFTLDD